MTRALSWEEYEADVPVECLHCGWKGTTKQAELHRPDETVAEVWCPQCRNYDVALIDIALTPEQILQRAAKGDAYWQAYLKNQDAIAESLLKSIDELPDLPGLQELDFVWDHEVGDHNPTTVIRMKDATVAWKERAYFGGQHRFQEVEELLKKKYGSRFRSFQINFDNYYCSI